MRVGDIDLALEEDGEGFPVVLVHGFTGSKEDWTYVRPALSSRFRVVAYDHRGHGQSAKPRGLESYSLDLLAEDLAGLLDALSLERCHLIGHSMGGVVVQRYLASRGTDRVGRVVLVDTLYSGGRSEHLEHRIRLAGAEGMAAVVAYQEATTSVHPSLAAMPEVVEFLRRRLLSMSAEAFAALGYGLLGLADTRPSLQSVDVPVLVVCGERDEGTTPEINKALADAIPGGRYVEIPNAGHTPQVENVPAWLDAVVPFLEREGNETPP